MGKMAYHLNTYSEMKKILEKWNPKPIDKRKKEPTSEKEYEKSLLAFLQEELQGVQIIPQGGRKFSRGDLVIIRKSMVGGSYEDVIELKLGLKSCASYQRLVGQIETYEPGRHGMVFVVICGKDADPKLLMELRLKYRGRTSIGIFHKKTKRGIDRIV